MYMSLLAMTKHSNLFGERMVCCIIPDIRNAFCCTMGPC